MPERVVRVVLEGDAGRRVPLGVLLGEALRRVSLDADLLKRGGGGLASSGFTLGEMLYELRLEIYT